MPSGVGSGTRAVRLASAEDAAAIQAIYAPLVRDTIISFETEPPTVDEMRGRIAETAERWPWLVCEIGGTVVGYAYAGEHRGRAAYRWSVDVSAYVAADRRRQGVATDLYSALLAFLERQGYCNAFAGIALPNPASVAFHESLGFAPVGVYRKVGFKLGAWHDVGWWGRALREHAASPPPPLPVSAVDAPLDRSNALADPLPD